MIPPPDHPEFNPDKTVSAQDEEITDLYSQVYQLEAKLRRIERGVRNTVLQALERERDYLKDHDELDLNDPKVNAIHKMKQYGLAILAEIRETTLSVEEDKLYWDLTMQKNLDTPEAIDISGFM